MFFFFSDTIDNYLKFLFLLLEKDTLNIFLNGILREEEVISFILQFFYRFNLIIYLKMNHIPKKNQQKNYHMKTNNYDFVSFYTNALNVFYL